jgi:hypothetical protein
MDYNFSTLSPHDFELLTQDLLQREFGFRLEGFKSGRDRGVDLRRCQDRSTGLIVQCKHYARSTFSKLKSDLEKKEVPKVAKLMPKRYVVATSRPLSVGQKDALVAVMSPYCHGPNDVFGAEDLNALLRKHPDIEKAHFKLWIASIAVLQAVLNNDLFSRSYLETEEIKDRLSLFVPTDAVARAMEALQSHGFCLLSGIPGIGKTTTAEMLVALMLDQGWECVCISSNATEALKAYDQERRQLFYYDDFLGQTSLTEKLGKNEDHELTRLIRTCGKRPKSKRLILTTRNYLLAQAVEQHEVLTRADIDAGNCIVKLADYTPRVRAQILVNHLWFFGVKDTWCRRLVESGAARKIVDHPNYSPRLVEAICKRASTAGQFAASFAKEVMALFDDPTDLWRHPYQNQLSDAARELLICFASLGTECYLEALRHSYRNFVSQSDDEIFSEERFHRALRELEGTFLQIETAGTQRTVAYNNPSVKDFMDGLFETTPAYSKRVLKTAAYYSQVGYAARHVLGSKRNTVAETLVCTALRRHVFGETAVPEKLLGEALGAAQIQPALRLLTWRESYRNTVHATLRAELCNLAIEYLNGGDYRRDKSDDVAELVRLTAADAVMLSVDAKLDLDVVKQWLWGNLKSLDDHIAMGWWVEDWEDGEAKVRAYKQLRKSFMDVAEATLDDLTEGGHSSSDIEAGIGEIEDAAQQLGVDATEIDTDAAESAREVAEEAEEQEADMQEDEWRLKRMEELAAKEEVDDILDSLR